MMFLHIIDATYLEDYKLKVSFSNGQQGEVDLSPALKGSAFEALRNKDVFSSFTIDQELETIVWSNGVDLAPEYVYFQTFKHDPALQAQFKQWGYIV